MKKLVVAAACVIAANANADQMITIGTFASWHMSADQKSISIEARDVYNTGSSPVGAIGLDVLACATIACPSALVIGETGELGGASSPGEGWPILGKANNAVTLPPKGLYYVAVAAYEISNPKVYFPPLVDSASTFEVVEVKVPVEEKTGGGAFDLGLGLMLGLFGFMRRFALRAMS